jgi:hypothetical protein
MLVKLLSVLVVADDLILEGAQSSFMFVAAPNRGVFIPIVESLYTFRSH